MSKVTIRIYFQDANGTLSDGAQDFGVESFAGQIPLIGDMIVDPGVIQGLDRHNPVNREVWEVVGRVFNPRDLANYVVLIVKARSPQPAEYSVVV